MRARRLASSICIMLLLIDHGFAFFNQIKQKSKDIEKGTIISYVSY